MDDVLRESPALVLRDLRATGAPEPGLEDDDWTRDPDYPSAMLRGPDGSGSGVSATRDAAWADRVAGVADHVQEWVIEELWRHGPINWPRCPQHPETHPMRPVSRDGTAVWSCPADQTSIAPVGDL